jgi:Family of unknown function (DUF6152)
MTWMKSRKTALAAVLLSAAATLPVQAHHSFAGFDSTRTVTLICTVREFQWVNPHSWLIVVAPNDQGNEAELRFEGVPPAILTRSGWTADAVLAGDRISLDFHPMKDGSPGGAYVAVTLPNGKRLGTSGTSFVPYAPPSARPPPSQPPAPPLHPIIIE